MHTDGQKSFTLIEVVLAMAILGICLFVLIEATGRCLAVVRVAKNLQTARTVMELGELEHPLSWSNDVSDNTVSGETYLDRYTFSRELKPSDDEPTLYIVTTRVAWSERGKASFHEVVSCLYCPEKK